MMPPIALTVPDDTPPGTRLDRFLADHVDGLSRSRLQALIEAGHVLCNGQTTKARQAVRPGEDITVEIPASKPAGMLAQEIPLEILYEDADLAVLVKPSGLVVHPAVGNPDGTLVNALLHRFGGMSSIGGVDRPGIVHRLDKETSGLMVVARNDISHQSLSAQFADREVTKKYLAVIHGVSRAACGEIRTDMGRHPVNRQKRAVLPDGQGKPAATDYQVLHVLQAGPAPTSLVCCHLHTGRTHQIRVHLHHLGHPILGDPLYGNPNRQPRAARLMLHAWFLSFRHPGTNATLRFNAPPPPEFLPWRPESGWPQESFDNGE